MSEADAQFDPAVSPSGPGCVECTAVDGWWVHLRRCAACGHIGCCDSSPAQHASGHFEASGHRYIQSYEPGEEWYWDFVDQTFADGPPLTEPTSHPVDQPTPGPVGRVPADWMQHIH